MWNPVWIIPRSIGCACCRLGVILQLLLMCQLTVALSAEEKDHGILIPEVRCAGAPDQSYVVYLPPGYNAGRLWPIVYCFDPGARGRLPVERFQAAAERLGYIVVGSNNSRNGEVDLAGRVIGTLLNDTRQRLKIDEKRRYAAGFSGGARVACAVAQEYGFAGVVANGAGFPDGVTPAEVRFAFFGVVGREDINYLELQGVQKDLQARPFPHRLAIFEGTHEWLPVTVATQALEWMDVQAMRAALVPRDEVWLRETFNRQLQAARAQTEVGRVYAECVELLADFRAMADTKELETWISAQSKTKAVRRYLAAEKQSTREEAEWRERFAAAIGQALHGIPEQEESPESPFDSSIRREPDARPWDDSSTGGFEEFGRPSPPSPRIGWKDFDRFARLQREVKEARSEWDHRIAVRRALRFAGLNLREQAMSKFLLKEYDQAGDMLKIAIILLPEESGPYFKLAWVRALQGRKKEAHQQMENAIKRGFNDQAQLGELSRALASGGDGSKTVLEPMFITTKRDFSTSYGLGLTIYADPETRELVKILITTVSPDSEAAGWGLGQGEEIIGINGRTIRSFTADFSPDGEFARLFSKRRNGETISLEIQDQNRAKPRLVSLTQGRRADEVMRPWLQHE